MGMWWFGRILTFEAVADTAPPSLDHILSDVSRGVVDCNATARLGGYAASGQSVRNAIEPIVESFALDLVDDGSVLRSPVSVPATQILPDCLGCSADGRSVAAFEREEASARTLPSSLLLSFYDAQRDYQTGQAQSEVAGETATEARVELPAVITVNEAKILAEQTMARHWAQRDKMTLRLPPRFMTLEPGSEVRTSLSSLRWRVHSSAIDGMVVVAELRPVWNAQASVTADSGRLLPSTDIVIGQLSLALVELPDLTGEAGFNPTIYLAASTATPAWKRVPVEVSGEHFLVGVRTARRKSIMGSAATILGDGEASTLDTVNSVDVELIDADQWLVSCDDDALAGGTNLALLGDELLQFADAEPLGPGHFRLTRFLRGRYATSWAMGLHASGDLFLIIDPAALQRIALPTSARDTTVTASCRSVRGTATASRLVDGRSLRSGLFIGGEQVVGRRATSIAAPSGGGNIDPEARAAVSQILAALRSHGLIDT